jgi:hypothetical protein
MFERGRKTGKIELEIVRFNFSGTALLFGDDAVSLSESHRHIHADGLNGRKQASGLVFW